MLSGTVWVIILTWGDNVVFEVAIVGNVTV